MKLKYLLILGLLMSLSANAQIWNYPPLAISNWSENDNIKKDSIEKIIVWNHKIVEGVDLGEKELKMIQELDSIGNTVKIIYGHGDTVLFDKYLNGFWQRKIANGMSYHQSIQFDLNGNVTELTINDFKQNVSYDSLNRPLKSTNNSEEYVWLYEEENLSEYTIFKNGAISEKRKYYYDTIKNTISYSRQFYDINEQKYNNPDSVSAYFNQENEIYKIISFSHYSNGWDTLTLLFDKENNIIISNSTANGSQKVETIRNESNLPISVIISNQEGEITRKTSYEYEFKTEHSKK